jgi:uncharacterized repeat protein (TIGR01451 family)
MKIKPFFTAFLLTFSALTFALDTPTEDFTINNDGTVLHKKTGLTWQRCSVGQTWNATTSTCDGTTSTMIWNDAMASYSTGKACDDWRLPRQDELYSITEHGKYNPPHINSTIFPNTTTDYYFWSASVYASNPYYAWVVRFNYGDGNYYVKDYSLAVRLVRGGQSCSFDPLTTPTTDFTDNKDGTVTHKKTGLMWQRCSIGQTWNGSTCTGSESSMTWDKATKQTSTLADQNDWRLPTQNELKTIVEYGDNDRAINLYGDYGIAINLSVFPNTPSVWFWSASVNAYDPSSAGIVIFNNGDDSSNFKGSNNAVRLVRGTWSAPTITTPVVPTTIDLSTTISASTPRVKINENLTYTATVINNGTGTANNSLLKFYLPPRNVSIVSMPSDCAVTGKSLTCSIGNLAAGANTSRSVTVTYTKSGGSSVSSLVLTDSEDTNSANNVSRLVTAIKK